MMLLGLDPGPCESGWCVYYDRRVLVCGISPNAEMLDRLASWGVTRIACEMVQSFGMSVGRETFETVLWTGRYVQRAADAHQIPVRLVYRTAVKLHICHSARAKDTNIRQALLDLLGPVGTKRQPGPLFGVRGHVWSALAIAVYADQVPESAPVEAVA